ncbi:glycosyltransferase family 1 protein [Spirosoma soli]|uniref:Glycosyltransferase family 1 protein n=1 Tax=Spirosoma soli TaxID=1770529 RepID=A0ABW5LXR9_9BACT
MNYLESTHSTTSTQQPLLTSNRLSDQKIQSIATRAAASVEHLVCFSHLRWKFVYQRPQHLLSRASRQWHIWFVEEPMYGDECRLDVCHVTDTLSVVVPHLAHGTNPEETIQCQRELVDQLLKQQNINEFIAWYYTPMALAFSNHLRPRLTVYDCMDELSAFHGAPPSLIAQEKSLLKQADVVFTGGISLYEAKQAKHPRVFAFPSSIDHVHFAESRQALADPADMSHIEGPRIGFCGVIDERLNLDLLRGLAERRPDWQFVLLGPVVKIDPATLPQGPNLHYLGMKSYEELPSYFGNWNAAIMPFAINDATRYISPTKTPEYLAAGLPVVSTPIRDVIRTYGSMPHVLIADSVYPFEQALDKQLSNCPTDWTMVDAYLRENTWDNTWVTMQRIMQSQLSVVAEQ